MASNRIGCSAGKTHLIDPNNFSGQGSSDNISVPLEDLNITVQLETQRKGRTVLSSKGGASTTQSSDTVKVTFIEGSVVNGEKVLTSKFTDLTTVLDQGSGDGENLGITNIDIDFNSSYAPLITISFIDLRGSSIFQNEHELIGGKNKYSVFFELPYPLYELTIKGYYGQPVRYCLHMTKFTSKFNSQTGNFEITGSFIGYTYAMLSDMLLGILKAIPYTTKGIEKYRVRKDLDPTLLNLNELMIEIGNIDVNLTRIGANDPDAGRLLKLDTLLGDIDKIKKEIQHLGVVFDYDKTKGTPEFYRYIVIDDTITTSISDYQTNVSSIIKEFNGTANDIGFSNLLNSNTYTNLTLLTISPVTFGTLNNTTSKPLKKDILDRYKYINSENKVFSVYDLTVLFEELNQIKHTLEVENKKTELALANTVRETIKTSLKFEPTIRNIVNTFTAAVEVFLSVIFEVSTDTLSHKERKTELGLVFKPDAKNTDAKNKEISKFYPWPDYREYEQKNGYTEKYLGSYGVLNNPSLVDELQFIDELYEGFIKAKEAADLAALELEQETTTWIPVNPFDTTLYVKRPPYSRIGSGANSDDVIRLMLIRAMTFLGFTHDENILETNNPLIVAMATAEANAIIESKTLSSSVKNAVNIKLKTHPKGSTNFDALSAPTRPILINDKGNSSRLKNPSILQDNGNNTRYDYIFTGKKIDYELDISSSGGQILTTGEQNKIIPLSTNFIGDWNSKLPSDDNKGIFLTNYGPAEMDTENTQPLDGGKYIDIKNVLDFDGAIGFKGLIEDVGQSDNVINLAKLKQGSNDAYNIFGGKYGIEEFVTMDWGNDEIKDLPLMYVFYSDSVLLNGQPSNLNCLTRSRSYSGFPDKYIYDIDKLGTRTTILVGEETDTFLVDDGITVDFINNQIINNNNIRFTSTSGPVSTHIQGITTDPKKESGGSLHKGFGDNRKYFNLYNNNETSICYPYIEQKYVDTSDSDTEISFSLFGSKWYYGQRSEAAKALLFLNTLPFNGKGFHDVDDSVSPYKPLHPEILNMFNKVGGFIHAPKLWCAYIGGLIWRSDIDKNNEKGADGKPKIVGGKKVWKDPIIWRKGSTIDPTDSNYKEYDKPTRTQFFKINSTVNQNKILSKDGNIDDRYDIYLKSLPEQVKDAFYLEFYQFVNSIDTNGYGWRELSNKLEIYEVREADNLTKIDYKETSVNFNKLVDTMYKEAFGPSGVGVKASNYKKFKNLDNYAIIAPIKTLSVQNGGEFSNDALFLELRGNHTDNVGMGILLKAMSQEVVIANSGPNVWGVAKKTINGLGVDSQIRLNIETKKTNLQIYLDTLKQIIEESVITNEERITKNKQDVFGTDSEDVVKLQLYRTCKNVYDKWVGGADDGENLIFQCGANSKTKTLTKNNIDKSLRDKYREDDDKERLIDSFRFVSRSFKDIGNDFFVDPRPVNKFLKDNPDSSFYTCITDLLSSNNFDFIALPSYINYNDKKVMESIFEPYSYKEHIENGTCGPSFVCVYVGQTSKNLDFGDSEYENDGFDVQCKDGNMVNTLPIDFTQDNEPYENNVAVFKVAYSQQNQNIFKDITLDQSEFTETDESLKIIDDISKTGSENQRHFGGQNLYSVYSVRSYKAEVEMMGNAMIQPMMYFQLDNIPMFHGAYMITHVKHNIKPNSMSTHFTGVRIRHPETPILKANELYLTLLQSIEITSTNTTPSSYGGIADRPPKSSIPCGGVSRTVIDFDTVLKDVVFYLEGSYCSGGYKCGDDTSKPEKSGETLWGLDKKNSGTASNPEDVLFWSAVDAKKNGVPKFGQSYPKPNDEPELYVLYSKIITKRYTSFRNRYLTNSAVRNLIENDGRLYFNMIYASYNGRGFFQNWSKYLINEYNNGKQTSDELLALFVEDRMNGGPNAISTPSILIANTGVDIAKLVGYKC